MSTLRVNNLEPRTGTSINIASGTNMYIPGHVIQTVYQSFAGSQLSTTSASMVDSGLYGTITPKSTNSKILVTWHVSAMATTSGYGGGFSLYRNSTLVYNPSVAGSTGYFGGLFSASYEVDAIVSFSYLDSPASISSINYKLYFAAYNGNPFYINYTGVNNAASSITLMEIAG